mmetsp:Transcript_52655/g.171186  ORF Transcript_52655/g.171186 Transcript_52655/m.171186 type:complete len:315 (-) Transcript_52655:852-1796(-)
MRPPSLGRHGRCHSLLGLRLRSLGRLFLDLHGRHTCFIRGLRRRSLGTVGCGGGIHALFRRALRSALCRRKRLALGLGRDCGRDLRCGRLSCRIPFRTSTWLLCLLLLASGHLALAVNRALAACPGPWRGLWRGLRGGTAGRCGVAWAAQAKAADGHHSSSFHRRRGISAGQVLRGRLCQYAFHRRRGISTGQVLGGSLCQYASGLEARGTRASQLPSLPRRRLVLLRSASLRLTTLANAAGGRSTTTQTQGEGWQGLAVTPVGIEGLLHGLEVGEEHVLAECSEALRPDLGIVLRGRLVAPLHVGQPDDAEKH